MSHRKNIALLAAAQALLLTNGTTLRTENYRPEEKAKVQGSNDFIVLGVQGLTSLLWLYRRANRNSEAS